MSTSQPSPVASTAVLEVQVAAAAVLHDGSCDVDALLAAAVAQQRALGRRVGGLLMAARPAGADCTAAMVLVDVASGDTYLVSQAMGSGSAACRADPQGFARASQVLRRALDEAPDLVVCNRFGGLEADGGGFAAELLALMAQDVPLLTAVAARHVETWQRFSGGAALLPAQAGAVADWLQRTLAPRSRQHKSAPI